jgi:hypothetical protein
MLYAYLNLLYVHSKNSRNNISKNPFVLLVNEGEVNLLADSQLGTFFVALVTSWRCQVQCCGSEIIFFGSGFGLNFGSGSSLLDKSYKTI